MNEQLKTICEQFIADRDLLKAIFPWDNIYIIPVCAVLAGSRRADVSEEKIKECRKLTEQHTSIFFSFRGNTMLPLATLLACAEDPLDQLQAAMCIYSEMKEHLYGTEYLALASAMLAGGIAREEVDAHAARAKELHMLMKQKHPLLTTSEDSVYAALLAFSDKSPETLVSEMELCFQALKPKFHDSASVQSAAQVLTITGGDPAEKCGRLCALFDGLTAAGKPCGRFHELSALGVLALTGTDTDTLLEEIIGADNFLAGQKGYAVGGLDRKIRLLHAIMLVTILHDDDASPSMMASRLAALCTVIASCTTVNAGIV